MQVCVVEVTKESEQARSGSLLMTFVDFVELWKFVDDSTYEVACCNDGQTIQMSPLRGRQIIKNTTLQKDGEVKIFQGSVYIFYGTTKILIRSFTTSELTQFKHCSNL